MNRIAPSRRSVLVVALAPLLGQVAHAQAKFPERPLRLIVPLPAGSVSDVQARPVAQKLSESLGQPVVVENRPGASNTLGMDAAARSAPDGYTMVMGTIAPLTLLPHLMKLPYDPLKDFIPVTRVTSGPMVLVATPSAPYGTVAQMVEHSRRHPGQTRVAGFGVGTVGHLAVLLTARVTGADLSHLPYQGGPQQVADTMSGHVPLLFDFVAVVASHIRAGKLKALAVTSRERLSSLPDVPTFEELGHKGLVIAGWQGILVPAGTPAPIVRRLNEELLKAFAAPDVRELFLSVNAEIGNDTPEQFAAFIAQEYERWGRVIRDAGIRLE